MIKYYEEKQYLENTLDLECNSYVQACIKILKDCPPEEKDQTLAYMNKFDEFNPSSLDPNNFPEKLRELLIR